MQPYISYDEMIEERISADREIRIVCQRLRVRILGAWTRWQRRPRAGASRRRFKAAAYQ